MSRLSAADFDFQLACRAIPFELAGLRLTSWSVAQLQQAVRELGGRVNNGALKIDLCEQLRNLKPSGFGKAAFKQREWRALRHIVTQNLEWGSTMSSRARPLPIARNVGQASLSQTTTRSAVRYAGFAEDVYDLEHDYTADRTYGNTDEPGDAVRQELETENQVDPTWDSWALPRPSDLDSQLFFAPQRTAPNLFFGATPTSFRAFNHPAATRHNSALRPATLSVPFLDHPATTRRSEFLPAPVHAPFPNQPPAAAHRPLDRTASSNLNAPARNNTIFKNGSFNAPDVAPEPAAQPVAQGGRTCKVCFEAITFANRPQRFTTSACVHDAGLMC